MTSHPIDRIDAHGDIREHQTCDDEYAICGQRLNHTRCDTTTTTELQPGVRYVTLTYYPDEEALKKRIRRLNGLEK